MKELRQYYRQIKRWLPLVVLWYDQGGYVTIAFWADSLNPVYNDSRWFYGFILGG